MASPVTAADMAEALRRLMGVTFGTAGINERVRVYDESEDLLASFDAQQAEARKQVEAKDDP